MGARVGSLLAFVRILIPSGAFLVPLRVLQQQYSRFPGVLASFLIYSAHELVLQRSP